MHKGEILWSYINSSAAFIILDTFLFSRLGRDFFFGKGDLRGSWAPALLHIITKAYKHCIVLHG